QRDHGQVAEQHGAVAVGDAAELRVERGELEVLARGEVGRVGGGVQVGAPAVLTAAQRSRGGVLPGTRVVREGPGPGERGGARAVRGTAGSGEDDPRDGAGRE